MNINEFQNSFFCSNVKVLKKFLVVLFFVICLFFILVFNDNVYSYYSGNGIVKSGKLNILVNVKELDKILNNKKIIIERTTFTYEVDSLSENNLEYGIDMFKSILLKIDLPSNINVDNNYIDYQIVTGKDTIINYVFKTIFKGE